MGKRAYSKPLLIKQQPLAAVTAASGSKPLPG